MIAFLKGELLSKDLKSAIILVNGIGYQVFLPMTDLAQFADNKTDVSLHIHTSVREDAIELFGFLSLEKKHLFEHLIGVTGIGPKTALAMLSGMEPSEFTNFILQGNHAALTSVPGVGPKTAQRLVLELKDRLKKLSFQEMKTMDPFKNTLEDLRSAVLNLGYKTNMVEKAIRAVEPLAKQGQSLEHLVKEALRHLH